MSLALRSHISVATWLAEEDPRILPTAFELLAKEDEALKRRR